MERGALLTLLLNIFVRGEWRSALKLAAPKGFGNSRWIKVVDKPK